MATVAHRHPSKSERTRTAVLAAAEELFAERGFDATPLGTIGERVGIQASAVLYHYATKRELYEAVLERMFSPIVEEVLRLLRGDGSLVDRLETITVRLVRFTAERPAAARMVLREAVNGSEGGEIVGDASQRPWQRFVEALTAEDGVTFDPLVVWNIIVGAICFYVGAGLVVGGLPANAHDPAQIAALEMHMARVTRALCGFDPI